MMTAQPQQPKPRKKLKYASEAKALAAGQRMKIKHAKALKYLEDK